MPTTPTLDELERAWIALDEQTPPDITRVRQWAFHRILRGRAAATDEAGEELGMTPSSVSAAVSWLREAGLITEREGIITGSMGLTTEKTPHALTLDQRRLHVWCALDAVGIPAALNARAEVQSRLADDDEAVRLVFDGRSWSASRDVDVLVTLPELDDCINEDVCPSINFYSRGAAPIHPRASALTLDETTRLGRGLWGRHTQPPTREGSA